MSENNNDNFNVDDLLNSLFKPVQKESLSELFDRRIRELKLATTTVSEILKIEYRSLYGILNGTQKRIDFTNIIKIANFLQLPVEQVAQLYIESLEKNFPQDITSTPEKIDFIRENFDLVVLRKSGFIDSISDFEQIENKIVSFFGLKSIFDYKKLPVDVAFSAGLVKPKSELTRSFWIKAANDTFEEMNNPYEYNRDALIKYFPEIRWHSTNVELGLINIIRDLYKIGITVIYQSSLPSLHLRGATFAVNYKPCIVLTNYVGFYPTMWFALIHELFHVLFDWEEIESNSYHLSDNESEQLSVIEKEKEADNFAREYLFSKEKTNTIRPHLKDSTYIDEFASNNHVHPSFIYVFNAYDTGNNDRMAWAKAKKQTPNIDNLIKKLDNPWHNIKPISDYVKAIKFKYYN